MRTRVKLVDREVLLREKEEKQMENEKRIEREKKRLEKERLEQQREVQRTILGVEYEETNPRIKESAIDFIVNNYKSTDEWKELLKPIQHDMIESAINNIIQMD